MTRPVVLITTPWLRAMDEVHQLLRDQGADVHFSDSISSSDVTTSVDAIIAGTEPIRSADLDAAPRLKTISRTGVGYDNVDVAAATQRGISVCTTPGVNQRSVAEFTLALMLNTVRGIPANSQSLRAGGWDQKSGIELHGKTVGVIGFGSIGQAVADVCSALGMNVVGSDLLVDNSVFTSRGVARLQIPELLAVSDIVSLHLPLIDSTRNILDEEAFRQMKPGAFLINTARGGLIDETALGDALLSGRIAGAALDAFTEEPLPSESPLLGLPNLIVTTHIAGSTVEGRQRSGVMAAESVIEALRGNIPEHAVNRDELDAAVRKSGALL